MAISQIFVFSATLSDGATNQKRLIAGGKLPTQRRL